MLCDLRTVCSLGIRAHVNLPGMQEVCQQDLRASLPHQGRQRALIAAAHLSHPNLSEAPDSPRAACLYHGQDAYRAMLTAAIFRLGTGGQTNGRLRRMPMRLQHSHNASRKLEHTACAEAMRTGWHPGCAVVTRGEAVRAAFFFHCCCCCC